MRINQTTVKFFLSYGSEDRQSAHLIKDRLKKNKYFAVEFYDYFETPIETDSSEPTDRGLLEKMRVTMNANDHIIFVLSRSSASKNGAFAYERNVEREVAELKPPGHPFAFAVLIDDYNLPAADEWAKRLETRVARLSSEPPYSWESLDKLIVDIDNYWDREHLLAKNPSARPLTQHEVEQIEAPLKRIRRVLTVSDRSYFLAIFLGNRLKNHIPPIYKKHKLIADHKVSEALDGEQIRRNDVRHVAIVSGGEGTRSIVLSRWLEDFNHKRLYEDRVNSFTNSIKSIKKHEWPQIRKTGILKSNSSDCVERKAFAIRNAPGSRDVIGFLVPLDDEELQSELTAGEKDEFSKALQDFGLALLDWQLSNFKEELRLCDSRQAIQDATMETVLTLSGADWGCIKTGCLSKIMGKTIANSGEKVAAECVYHCPMFYVEGANPIADSGVDTLIKGGVDGQIAFSDSHPAKSGYGFLIRDPTRSSLVTLEPTIVNQLDAIVGVLVLQHSSRSFLENSVSVFGPYVRSALHEYADRLLNLSAEQILESVKYVRQAYLEQTNYSLAEILNDSIQKASTLDPELDLQDVDWILIDTELTSESINPIVAYSCRNVELATLKQLVGLSLENDQKLEDTLLFHACNSRYPLYVSDIAHRDNEFHVRRNTRHPHSESAYFHHRFCREELANKDKKKSCGIDLGPYVEVDNLSVLVIPLVFTTGVVVGAIAIFTPSNIDNQHIEYLFTTDGGVRRIARALYQKRHRPDVTQQIIAEPPSNL